MQNACMQLMSVNCEYSILKTGLSLVILFSKLGEKNTYLAYCNFFFLLILSMNNQVQNMGSKELN